MTTMTTTIEIQQAQTTALYYHNAYETAHAAYIEAITVLNGGESVVCPDLPEYLEELHTLYRHAQANYDSLYRASNPVGADSIASLYGL